MRHSLTGVRFIETDPLPHVSDDRALTVLTVFRGGRFIAMNTSNNHTNYPD